MTDLMFGLNVPASAAPGADPVALAVAAEDLGFDFISAADHPCGNQPTHETWTMLSWIAASTSRIRVATRVLGVPYRNPAMVAKMAETLDRLSGGRLILGLGGGYSDDEFRAFGLPVPSPGDKVDGLAEAIQITRGLWSGPAFTFEGRRYRTAAADLEPKPGHRIPIWLGTFGDRALGVTGRLADGWIPSLGYAPAGRLAGMRDRVLAAARQAGRDPGQITCALNLQVRVDSRGQATSATSAAAANPSVLADPSVLAGPPAAVAAQLAGFVRMGFTALNFILAGPDAADPAHQIGQAELLAREVLPEVAAAAAA